MQRTAFQKNRLADSGAIVDGEAADVENYTLHGNCNLILEQGTTIFDLRSWDQAIAKKQQKIIGSQQAGLNHKIQQEKRPLPLL
jgi:hypothetical protein